MTLTGDKALPKFLRVDDAAPPTRRGASKDGSFETGADWDAEMVADGAMSVDELLAWMVREIENRLGLTTIKT